MTMGLINADVPESRASISAPLLTAVCAGILFVMLVAGLWPFHAPRNEVSWLSQENGLRFGKNGSILSAGAFAASRVQANGPCSIEIWLQPSGVDSGGTIIAFYRPSRRVVGFKLRQYETGMETQTTKWDQSNEVQKMFADGVFVRSKPVYLTITSSDKGTAFYADGTLVRKSAQFKVSSEDLTGQLVVGNAPSVRANWSGLLKGLSVYGRELPPDEVLQHYSDRSHLGRLDSTDGQGIVARYEFKEGAGSIVHNQVDSATDLSIPERYFVIHERFLKRPWKEFHPDWSYLFDIGVNIAGFIPFGFFFSAYFSMIGKLKRFGQAAIAAGFVLSFAIETLQAFLPTRESGMTDLFTNTFGTFLGATAFSWFMTCEWFAPQRSSIVPFNIDNRERVGI
jgi:VanZ family protein